ncbi:MAG: alanyl-tRNA editing protein [Candidatus Anstonellales archaeon]
MEEQLYLKDSYASTCDSKIVRVIDGRFIELSENLFYPGGGGQPADGGKIIRGDEEFQLISAKKEGGWISYEVEKEGLREGDTVKCILDWKRRYKLMRLHSAAHTLAALLHKESGALITGNQIDEEKARFDFSLESFERTMFENCIKKANELFLKNIPVKTYYLPREVAMNMPGIVKLARALPPSVEQLRIVEIEGIDVQADGGTHVRNLLEVGQIEFLKAENKGKSNRRVYFKLKE